MEALTSVVGHGRRSVTLFTTLAVTTLLAAGFGGSAFAKHPKRLNSSPCATNCEDGAAFKGPDHFKCYFGGTPSEHQYTCRDKDKKPGEDGAWFMLNEDVLPMDRNPRVDAQPRALGTPKTFWCIRKGDEPADPASYRCRYRYDNGRKTFTFALDRAVTGSPSTDASAPTNWYMPLPEAEWD